MKGLVKIAALAFLGALIGLVTAQSAISGRFGMVAQSKGPWTVWPDFGKPKIDPYTRAHHLSYGLLPANRFESLEYQARVDNSGRVLDGECSYLITGPMPEARWWSLSTAPGDGEDEADSTARQGIVSRQLIYEADQAFRVVLSPEFEAGNWIQPPDSGEVVLLFRLYTPDPALRRNALAAELPSIERQVCR